MNDSDFKFPLLCINRSQGVVEPAHSFDGLTRTTSASLKNDWFTNLLLIDSQGKVALVEKAEKISGIGMFWGFNIFLDQSIRVALQFASRAPNLTLAEMKTVILALTDKDYAQSDKFYGVFLREFKESKTFQEAIHIYCDFYGRSFNT